MSSYTTLSLIKFIIIIFRFQSTIENILLSCSQYEKRFRLLVVGTINYKLVGILLPKIPFTDIDPFSTIRL